VQRNQPYPTRRITGYREPSPLRRYRMHRPADPIRWQPGSWLKPKRPELICMRYPVPIPAARNRQAHPRVGTSAQPRTSHGIADHKWRCWPLHKNAMAELAHIGRFGRWPCAERPNLCAPCWMIAEEPDRRRRD